MLSVFTQFLYIKEVHKKVPIKSLKEQGLTTGNARRK